MIFKGLRFVYITILIITFSGCSSIMTYLGPLKSELVDGETSHSELSRYDYGFQEGKHTLLIEKTPMCKEMVQRLRLEKKQLRGFPIAIFELIFYGFGLLDMACVYGIIENSKKVEPLAYYATGNLLVCGEKIPAGNETFVIENKIFGIHQTAITNADGLLKLDPKLSERAKMNRLNIYLKNDPSVSYVHHY
ncbi:MAG: hypothetical protein HF978_00430 [Desulfobacteraceae bacterium]|nr:hypothetical protein [Desulfobacteraceae bacterium]MBC2754000.1 hypothetical protein [Desulfobacteraceae bacterium]